jgi:ribonucleoside-diphosphate reductase beta chain
MENTYVNTVSEAPQGASENQASQASWAGNTQYGAPQVTAEAHDAQPRYTVTDAKGYYKPFRYPFAFDAYRLQRQMDWLPDEVPLAEDVKDWNQRLNQKERNLLTQLFRFFTQGDIDVGQAYMDKYIPIFKNEEVRMMLSAFLGMEAVHAHAYSLLLDTIGMPEVEYQAFKKYEVMAAKHDYIASFDVTNEADVAKALAVFSAFTEGLQLFSTFAILMNFSRGDLPSGARMKGMNQIVTWSIRDESLHVESMSRLFRVYIEERPHLWTAELQEEIYAICRKMVELEDSFIDLAFAEGGIEGLEPAEVKLYIRYIADRRLQGIMLEPIFNVGKNPLIWLDYMMSGVEHANFFENRATEYAKGTLTGSWNDVWAQPEDVVPGFAVDSSDYEGRPMALPSFADGL